MDLLMLLKHPGVLIHVFTCIWLRSVRTSGKSSYTLGISEVWLKTLDKLERQHAQLAIHQTLRNCYLLPPLVFTGKDAGGCSQMSRCQWGGTSGRPEFCRKKNWPAMNLWIHSWNWWTRQYGIFLKVTCKPELWPYISRILSLWPYFPGLSQSYR